MEVSFSKVTYADRVGLREETQTFELHRSRISTELFKSIVMDMDVTLMQYGPLPDHQTIRGEIEMLLTGEVAAVLSCLENSLFATDFQPSCYAILHLC